MDTRPDDDKKGEALSAQRFQMLEDIARELSGNVVFPTTFDLATRLRKALQDPDLPQFRLAEMLELEPLISARIVGLANASARRHNSPEIRSIHGAVAQLGTKVVRNRALNMASNQLLRAKDLLPFGELANSLWQHSLYSAAAAEVVARRMTGIAPEEALLAGLVHDLGAFYMLYRASQYPELRARPETVRYLITQWHEGIGHTLLVALGIPHDLVDATSDHDKPRPAPRPPKTLSDVIFVANMIAGGKFEWLSRDSDAPFADKIELPVEFSDLTGEISEREAELRQVLG